MDDEKKSSEAEAAQNDSTSELTISGYSEARLGNLRYRLATSPGLTVRVIPLDRINLLSIADKKGGWDQHAKVIREKIFIHGVIVTYAVT